MIKGTYTLTIMEEQLFSDKKDLVKELNVCFNNVAADNKIIKKDITLQRDLIIQSFYILFPKHEVHNLSVIKDEKQKNIRCRLVIFLDFEHLFYTYGINHFVVGLKRGNK